MNTNKELTAFSAQEERHETYFGNEILHQDQVNIRLGKNIDHSLLNYRKGFGHVNFKMVKKKFWRSCIGILGYSLSTHLYKLVKLLRSFFGISISILGKRLRLIMFLMSGNLILTFSVGNSANKF